MYFNLKNQSVFLRIVALAVICAQLIACNGGTGEPVVDTQPKPFIMPLAENLQPGQIYFFPAVTVEDFDQALQIQSTAGAVSVDGGPFKSASQSIEAGQQFVLRIQISPSSLEGVRGEIELGEYSVPFVAVTMDIDTDTQDLDFDGDLVPNYFDPAPLDAKVTQVVQWKDQSFQLTHHVIEGGTEFGFLHDFNQDGWVDIVQLKRGALEWARGGENGAFETFAAISSAVHNLDSSDIRPSNYLRLFDLDNDKNFELIVLAENTAIYRYDNDSGWSEQFLGFESTDITEVDGRIYFNQGGNKLRTISGESLKLNTVNCNSIGDITYLTNNTINQSDDKKFLAFRIGFPSLYSYSTETKHYECIKNDNVNLILEEGGFYPSNILTADFNGDGQREVVVSFRGVINDDLVGITKLSHKKNNGLDVHSILNIDGDYAQFGYSYAQNGDFDNDGDQDIVALQYGKISHYNGKTISFYENNGAGIFTFRRYNFDARQLNYESHLHLVDINNDGLLDVYTGSSWLERTADTLRFVREGDTYQFKLPIDGADINYSIDDESGYYSVDRESGTIKFNAPSLRDIGNVYRAWLNADDGYSTIRRLIEIRVVDNNRDYDNDGFDNDVDWAPHNANEWRDTDGDGIGNNEDNDSDNDGAEDILDIEPENNTVFSHIHWSAVEGESNPVNQTYLNLQNKYPKEFKIIDANGDGRSNLIFYDTLENELKYAAISFYGNNNEYRLLKPNSDCRFGEFDVSANKRYMVVIENCIGDVKWVNVLDFSTQGKKRFRAPDFKFTHLNMAKIQLRTDYDVVFSGVISESESTAALKIVYRSLTSDDTEYSDKIFDGIGANFRWKKPFFYDYNRDGLDDLLSGSGSNTQLLVNQGNNRFVIEKKKHLGQFELVQFENSSAENRTFVSDHLPVVASDNRRSFFLSGNLDDDVEFVLAPTRPIALLDFNQDGFMDTFGFYNQKRTYFENNGNHRFKIAGDFGLVNPQMADFNGDGLKEYVGVVTGAYGYYEIRLLFPKAYQEKAVAPGETARFDLKAEAEDQQVIRYRIPNDLDARFFSVDEFSGVLTFVAPTEASDTNKDDNYITWVEAFSNYSRSRQLVSVTVDRTQN